MALRSWLGLDRPDPATTTTSRSRGPWVLEVRHRKPDGTWHVTRSDQFDDRDEGQAVFDGLLGLGRSAYSDEGGYKLVLQAVRDQVVRDAR